MKESLDSWRAMAEADIVGSQPGSFRNRERGHWRRLCRLATGSVGGPVLVAFVAILIYSNTFFSSFHFDDDSTIVNNMRIRDLSAFWNDPWHSFSGSRDIGLLTFALNYSVGGLSVLGYHLVNLCIHIVNGWLVLAASSLLARSPGMHPATVVWSAGRVRGVAFTAAMLFIAHPIQTQAVTYVVQRFTSLATLFYLLTVVCYLRWSSTEPTNRVRYMWYGGAVGAALLAMKTKEISFTLPFMLLLVDGVCFRRTTRERLVALGPFLLMLPIIPLAFSGTQETGMGWARETTDISRLDYLATQLPILITYLRLMVLPINQNLDYDLPIVRSLGDPSVVLAGAGLFVLAAATILLLVRSNDFRLVGLGLSWFFLTLSVESSIIPIRDVMFEHRLYLPSVGFFLAVSAAVVDRIPRWNHRVTAAIGLIVVLLAGVAYQRNRVWKDEVTLWADVVSKSPRKARAHNSLGNAYVKQRRYPEAVTELLAAIQLSPGYPDAHNNLGNAYVNQGRTDEGVEEYRIALRLNPRFPDAHNNLGLVYSKHEQLADAIAEFAIALQLNPAFADARNNLGNAYLRAGRLDEAISELSAVIETQPGYPEAHLNLANVYVRQRRWPEAAKEFGAAIQLDPNVAEAHNGLGGVYAEQGQWEDAVREFLGAIKLAPDLAGAHYNLGSVYARQGRLEDAIREYSVVIGLQPDHVDAHYNLGNVYKLLGLPRQARKYFEAALQLNPNFGPARQALESL